MIIRYQSGHHAWAMDVEHESKRGKLADLDRPKALIWAIRGFSCAFWGLPLSLLLHFGAIEMQIASRYKMPTYLVGAAIVLCGAAMLVVAALPTARWKRLARQGLIGCCLILYEGPIAYWYGFMSQVGIYYVVNMVILIGAVVWVFFAVNALAAELGELDGDEAFTTEARLSAWGAVGLMFIPMVAALGFSVTMALKYESSLLSEFRGIQQAVPIWITICFVVPLSLTMASAWKAKERCLDALNQAAQNGPVPGGAG